MCHHVQFSGPVVSGAHLVRHPSFSSISITSHLATMGISTYPTSAISMVNPERRHGEMLRHDEFVRSDEYVPKPLEDLLIYTDTEIRARIEWVKQRLTHQLTPHDRRFLGLHLSKLKDVATLAHSRHSIFIVQYREQVMADNRLLIEIPRYEVEEFMHRSRQLMQYRLLGRYSDFLAQILRKEKTNFDE